MHSVFLYRSSGRIPTVLRRYPYWALQPTQPTPAELFGKIPEEYGNAACLFLEPNGIKLWTPQTQDTEAKCRLLIITKIRKYKVSVIHIGLSEVVPGDYGSMTLDAVSNLH